MIEQQGLDGPIGMIGFRLAGHAVELGVRPRAGVLGPRLRHRGGAGGGGLALAEPTVYRVRAVCDVEHCASAHVLDNVGMEDISAGGPRGGQTLYGVPSVFRRSTKAAAPAARRR